MRQRPNKRRRGAVASKTRSFHRVALEPLEERRLLAATVYVDDDWVGTTLGAAARWPQSGKSVRAKTLIAGALLFCITPRRRLLAEGREEFPTAKI